MTMFGSKEIYRFKAAEPDHQDMLAALDTAASPTWMGGALNWFGSVPKEKPAPEQIEDGPSDREINVAALWQAHSHL